MFRKWARKILQEDLDYSHTVINNLRIENQDLLEEIQRLKNEPTQTDCNSCGQCYECKNFINNYDEIYIIGHFAYCYECGARRGGDL